jgi:hypothetical protein
MRPHRERVRSVAILGVVLASGVVAAFGCGFDGAGASSNAGPADGSALPSGDGAPPGADASNPDLDGAAAEASIDSGCGDVLTAALDCGRCGHSCLGGTCAAGKCQPVTLATESGLAAVALDATYVYFVAEDAGVIRKLPLAGGASSDVYATGRAPHDLAIDGDRVFWTDQFGMGVYVLGAGSGTQLTPPNGAARAVSVTASGPYFITAGTVDFWDRNLTTQVVSFVNNASSPAIVTDAAHAYWSAGKEIRRVVRATPTVENVVTGLATNPTSMAISATHVYWTTPTAVQRAPIAIGTGWVAATITSAETAAASVAVDATHAYWLDLTTGALRRAPIGGGAVETLAKFAQQRIDAPFPHQIALTSDAILIASTGDGTLSRLAK